MANPTAAFFEHLAERGAEPSLGRTTGSIRVDLDRDGTIERWRLDIRRGALTVSQSADPADCVLTAPGRLFDDLTTGRANAMAATLRTELGVQGDPGLLVRVQRLFPAPTGRRQTATKRAAGKRRG